MSEPTTPWQRTQTVCLVVLTVLAVAAALRWLAPVMIPFVLAIFFAVALAPLIELQHRYLRLPRMAGLGVTLGLAFLFFGGLATLVSASVAQLADNAAGYQTKATQLLNDVAALLPLERFGIDPDTIAGPLKEFSMGTLGSMLIGTTNAILEILSNGLLVLIFLLFLMLGASGQRPTPGSTWANIERRVIRFIVAKGALSAATGLLVGLVLALLGVDLALVFGLFAFLLNFIPSIGSVIATLLPLPVIVASPTLSPTAAVLALAIPAVIQFVIGSLLEPKVMGESLDVHPVTVLMNLIIWGMLWGIVGMLLATPLLVVIKILCEKFPSTEWLASLLAGRIEALRS